VLGDEAATVAFGAAYDIDESMWAFAAEGILGLGFSGLSRVTSPPFFEVVAAQVALSSARGIALHVVCTPLLVPRTRTCWQCFHSTWHVTRTQRLARLQ
jgi:hypothetical protein